MRYHCKQLVRYENANEVGFCGNYIPMYWKNAVSFCHISLYALLYQPFSKKKQNRKIEIYVWISIKILKLMVFLFAILIEKKV